jgi:mannose-6-phosphate isomerase-like protein (cupin superfamily)
MIEEKLLTDSKTGPESGMHQKELTFKVGESCPRHSHKNSTETYIVLQGIGQIQIGDETLQMKNGDYFVVQPGTEHQVENTGMFPLVLVSTKNRPADYQDYRLA